MNIVPRQIGTVSKLRSKSGVNFQDFCSTLRIMDDPPMVGRVSLNLLFSQGFCPQNDARPLRGQNPWGMDKWRFDDDDDDDDDDGGHP